MSSSHYLAKHFENSCASLLKNYKILPIWGDSNWYCYFGLRNFKNVFGL
jgi:hypothetical protein